MDESKKCLCDNSSLKILILNILYKNVVGVSDMGLLNRFSQWQNDRYQKRVAEMQSKGLCPDCRGSGLSMLALNEFLHTNFYDCPGCNGSGLYSDWEETNQY